MQRVSCKCSIFPDNAMNYNGGGRGRGNKVRLLRLKPIEAWITAAETLIAAGGDTMKVLI